MRLTALAVAGCALRAGCRSSSTPRPRSSPGAWSASIQGLSGRLHVEFEDLEPGLRHAASLELRNQSTSPVAVIDQPRLRAKLFDSGGDPVIQMATSASGPIPSPQWAVIPRDASIRFRVDAQ